MKTRPYTDFYARLLGGFAIYYRGKEIPIGTSLHSRSAQMLLMLLQARAAGVERSTLLALVRPKEKDLEKRSNNLRQHLHILRKVIARSGFPEGDYIILKGGRYYFSLTYKVETDVAYLDRLVARITADGVRAEERGALYLDYCRAYTGELLPMLGGEEWVTIESSFYQKWYITSLNAVCKRLRAEGRYETMLELCTKASQLHPYDEWQALQIECLMAMDRYKEAIELYEEAEEIYYKGLGPTSLDRVMEKYRDKDGRIRNGGNILKKVKRSIEEAEIEGPYFCSYPSFLDAYRIIARIGERMGTKNLLMLCTFIAGVRCGPEKGGDKAALGSRSRGELDRPERSGSCVESERCTEGLGAGRRRYIEERMIQLEQILTEDLRIGDVYTRYSENQYVVLLTEAGMGDGERIVARLEEHWKRLDRGGRARVRFMVQEVESPAAEGAEDGEKGNVRRECL